MKTVLVPVDFSGATARVCRVACAFAKEGGARVVLLHVVPPQAVALRSYGFAVAQVRGMLAAIERRAARDLVALARRCAKAGVAVQALQRTGDPATTILAKASSLHASTIVLGSHGHTAAYDLLVGSTTQRVLRRSRVPVLVVPMATQAER